jgi:hypothetical protein
LTGTSLDRLMLPQRLVLSTVWLNFSEAWFHQIEILVERLSTSTYTYILYNMYIYIINLATQLSSWSITPMNNSSELVIVVISQLSYLGGPWRTQLMVYHPVPRTVITGRKITHYLTRSNNMFLVIYTYIHIYISFYPYIYIILLKYITMVIYISIHMDIKNGCWYKIHIMIISIERPYHPSTSHRLFCIPVPTVPQLFKRRRCLGVLAPDETPQGSAAGEPADVGAVRDQTTGGLVVMVLLVGGKMFTNGRSALNWLNQE